VEEASRRSFTGGAVLPIDKESVAFTSSSSTGSGEQLPQLETMSSSAVFG
jgi:hypothetical protein